MCEREMIGRSRGIPIPCEYGKFSKATAVVELAAGQLRVVASLRTVDYP